MRPVFQCCLVQLRLLCFFSRDVQIGDIVTVGECRPLSKTVRFNVLKVTKAAGTKKQFQKF
uniref:Small ribosomal subunit protein uS17 n=1 Tax=Gopherus agassizii TaxID=38772 RepID=A0A452GUW4_9SAUR